MFDSIRDLDARPMNRPPGAIREQDRRFARMDRDTGGAEAHLRVDRRTARCTFTLEQFQAIYDLAVELRCSFTAAVRLLTTEALRARAKAEG